MWLMSYLWKPEESTIPDDWKTVISENIVVPEEDPIRVDLKYFAEFDSIDLDSATRRSIIRRVVEQSIPSWISLASHIVRGRYLKMAIKISSDYPIETRLSLSRGTDLDVKLMSLLEEQEKVVKLIDITVEDGVSIGFFSSNGILTLNVLEDMMKSWRYLIRTSLVNIFQENLTPSELLLIYQSLEPTSQLLMDELVRIGSIYTPLSEKKANKRHSTYIKDEGVEMSVARRTIEEFLSKKGGKL